MPTSERTETHLIQVSVFQGETRLGIGVIEHLDPPMGVAFGSFLPSDQYNRHQHANVVDGEYVADKGQLFLAHTEQHGVLKTRSITIEDWADPKIGVQLTLWFLDGSDFAALFSDHDEYRAYYAR